MFSTWMRALLLMPGIVLHEFAHQLFCHLAGVHVHEVKYFHFGNPAGYVVHSTPRFLRQHCAIVFGPFIVNSLLAIGCFLYAAGQWAHVSELWQTIHADRVVADVLGTSREGFLPALAWFLCISWLGWAIALEAIPSRADTRSLHEVTDRHIKLGNWLAIFSYPLVFILYTANSLRYLWLDWVYAGVLGWVGLAILPSLLHS